MHTVSMDTASTVDLRDFLGEEFSINVGWWRSLVDRDARMAATVDGLVQRVCASWPDARAAMLWDGDVCFFAAGGLVIADVGDGREAASSTVQVIPRSAIMCVARFDREDPKRRTVDPARRARAIGLVSGGVGSLVSCTPGTQMLMAMLVNGWTEAGAGQPLVWQFVEIRTDSPALGLDGVVTLELCDNAMAAQAIVETLRT